LIFLAIPSLRELELNELEWWSNWSEAKLFGPNSFLLVSDRLPEYFFNRAGFLECDGSDSAEIALIEDEFAKRSSPSTFVVPESCQRTIDQLKGSGYSQIDRMAVMALEEPKFRNVNGVAVEPLVSGNVKDWCRTYLLSFYGEVSLLPQVSELAMGFVKKPEVRLFAGFIDQQMAGVLATYRTEGLVGVYCVGTLPDFRHRGVAGALLSSASDYAESKGMRLILQTFFSDSMEDYYRARGFRRLYVKDVLQKGGPNPGGSA
jgi:ribosomal protein S18 acetylase RimI-like enzyme